MGTINTFDGIELRADLAWIGDNVEKYMLAGIAGGEYKLPSDVFVNGRMVKVDDYLSVDNSSTMACMPVWDANRQRSDTDPKNKPLYLNKGDVVTVGSGYEIYLQKTEYMADGQMKAAGGTYITDGASYTVEESGLYFIGRLYPYPYDSSVLFPIENAGNLVTVKVNGGIAGDIAKHAAEISALESASNNVFEFTNGRYHIDSLMYGKGASLAATDSSNPTGSAVLYMQNYTGKAFVTMPIDFPPNSKVDTTAYRPVALSRGDVISVAAGYKAFGYRCSALAYNGELYYKWESSMPWIRETNYTVEVSGLYFITRISKLDESNITIEEARRAVTVNPVGIVNRIDSNESRINSLNQSLNKNPYPVHFSRFEEVISATHAHCVNDAELANLAANYDHVAISNYHPSVPWYPLSSFYTSVPSGFLSSPCAEYAHFSDRSSGVHINGVGCFLSRETDHYGGTLLECIEDINKMRQHSNAGGITINHPTYSGLTAQNIIDIMDSSIGVFAMEVYNSNSEATDVGYAIDQWDGVLSTGRQLFGIFGAPDHEVEYHPNEERNGFGYNHVMVRSKNEEEILLAYTAGRFYGSIYNDSLKFNDLYYYDGTFTVETSEQCTIKFVTNAGETTSTGTTASYTPTANDVYVRVEATNGTNTLYSNAVVL
jgi:hypothetical protein